jgi:hypothetical protein
MQVHRPNCPYLDVPTDIAQLNHYYSKTREEFQVKKYNRIDDGRLGDHHFDIGNQNEIEDYLAYNFFKN